MTTNGPACLPSALDLLLKRVRHGDDEAFHQFYELTRARTSRVVADVLKAPEHSADVVQEVYLQVWQQSAAFDPLLGSALAWLTTLARRRAVDRVRQVVSSRRREQRDAATSDQHVADSADEGVARHEAARLREAVTLLSDHQREAVVLTYLYGYSNQEAATMLSLPLGTLKTRVRAGVINLRRQYAADAA